MISCQRQDIGQVRNPITSVSDAYSTSEETKSNREGDSTNIDQIIERLQDTEDKRVMLCLWKNTDLHIPKKILKLLSMMNRLL